VVICDPADSRRTICNATAGTPSPTEMCDLVDDDCDGMTDEGMLPGVGEVCGNALGTCQSGTFVGPHLREQVKDVCQRLGFESASGVTHTHGDRRLRPRRRQMDPAPRFSVFHGIVEQIREHLPEAFSEPRRRTSARRR